MKKYKITALCSVVSIGIGAFLGCLGTIESVNNFGSIILILGIIGATYSFYYWQP